METLRVTQKTTGSKIIIKLPKALENREVEVFIIAKDDEDKPENWKNLPGDFRMKILERFKGTASFPNAITNKRDVYAQ